MVQYLKTKLSKSFFGSSTTQSLTRPRTAFQFSPIPKKNSNLLDPLAWTSLLIQSRLSSPLSHLQINTSFLPASFDDVPASHQEPMKSSTSIILEVALSSSSGLQFPSSLPENELPVTTWELPPFSFLLCDVRPLLSSPNQFKVRPDHAKVSRLHGQEQYNASLPEIKQPT